MDDIAKAHEHLEESLPADPARAGLARDRVRLAARHAPDRRAPPGRRHRRRRRAGRELLQVYPTFTDLVFERAPGGPRARRPRGGARRCSSAASRWATRRRGSPAWSAAARSWRSPRWPAWPPTWATRQAPWRASRRASSGSRPTCRSASSWPTLLLARRRRRSRRRAARASRRRATTPPTWWLFLGTAFYERGHAEHRRGPVPARARAQRGAPGGHRRPGRGAAHAAPLRRGRRRPRRAADRHARVPRPAALARSSAAVAAGDVAARRRPPPPCSPRAAETRPRPPSLRRRSRATPTTTAPRADGAARRRVGARTPCDMLDALARLEEYELFERARADRAERRSATAARPR